MKAGSDGPRFQDHLPKPDRLFERRWRDKGLPPLDLSSEKQGDALIVSTEYVAPTKAETRGEAAIHHNASPTAIFVGDWMILSSAKPLALELLAEVRRGSAAGPSVNTRLLLDGQVARAALAENRNPLVARNMID